MQHYSTNRSLEGSANMNTANVKYKSNTHFRYEIVVPFSSPINPCDQLNLAVCHMATKLLPHLLPQQKNERK